MDNIVHVTIGAVQPCIGLYVGKELVRLTPDEAEALAAELQRHTPTVRGMEARHVAENAPQLRMSCDDQREMAV